MSLWTGPYFIVSYKIMEDKDVMLDRTFGIVYGRGKIFVGKVHLAETEDILFRHVWRWFPMSALFTRYPKDAY